jgi:hypothetical protein
MAAMRLHQLSNDDAVKRSTLRPDKADTSQYGNWSNFRNQTFRGKYIKLNSEFFLNLPQTGVLEFDYVCMYRDTANVKYVLR